METSHAIRIRSPPPELRKLSQISRHFRQTARVPVSAVKKEMYKSMFASVLVSFASQNDALQAMDRGSTIGKRVLKMEMIENETQEDEAKENAAPEARKSVPQMREDQKYQSGESRTVSEERDPPAEALTESQPNPAIKEEMAENEITSDASAATSAEAFPLLPVENNSPGTELEYNTFDEVLDISAAFPSYVTQIENREVRTLQLTKLNRVIENEEYLNQGTVMCIVRWPSESANVAQAITKVDVNRHSLPQTPPFGGKSEIVVVDSEDMPKAYNYTASDGVSHSSRIHESNACDVVEKGEQKQIRPTVLCLKERAGGIRTLGMLAIGATIFCGGAFICSALSKRGSFEN